MFRDWKLVVDPFKFIQFSRSNHQRHSSFPSASNFLHESGKKMIPLPTSNKQWGMVSCWAGNGSSHSGRLSCPLHQLGPTHLHWQMNIGKRKNDATSNTVQFVEDISAYLATSEADNTSYFSLLMENLKKIEEIFDNSDTARLERDILVQIRRLGALNIFHAALSRTFQAPDAPQQAFQLTETSKSNFVDLQVDDPMTNTIVRSGKKRERNSMRSRARNEATAVSTLSPSDGFHDFQQSPAKFSNRISRQCSVSQNESEMSLGLKEVTNLEKIRMDLEEKVGRAVSLSAWAHAAGMDIKVLQQRLHFGWHCRDKLLESTHSLVLYIARNYRGRGVGMEDMLQAGYMGVLKGAERFDNTRGYQFSTYVQHWIRKSISALIAQHSRGIRIPVRLNNVISQMQKARSSFYNLHRRYPQDEELSKFTGISLANIKLANNCTRVMDSLDRKVAECTSVKFMEIMPDKSVETPDETVMRQDMRRQICGLLSDLKPRERQVLALRYGLGDGQCKSLAEIGRLLHVTKECVRKTEKSALSKVRKEEVRSSLSYYLEV